MYSNLTSLKFIAVLPVIEIYEVIRSIDLQMFINKKNCIKKDVVTLHK